MTFKGNHLKKVTSQKRWENVKKSIGYAILACIGLFMKLITRMPKIDPEKVTPEIARFKGQKPKPKIKPSILEKQSSAAKKKKRNKRAKKSKKIEFHEVVPIEPEHIPAGSTYKGYQDYLVQDLIISNWNICYRRMRWKTPDGRYIVGSLPDEISGTHFDPTSK